jgi:hypothetical protein
MRYVHRTTFLATRSYNTKCDDSVRQIHNMKKFIFLLKPLQKKEPVHVLLLLGIEKFCNNNIY